MSSKASKLAASASFSHAAPAVSARRAATAAATKAPTEGTGQRPHNKLPLHLISENPDNPRESLGDLSDLGQTLTEVGLVNPITVVTVGAYLAERPERANKLDTGAEYVVVDGHRRLAAAREAGLKEIKYSLDDAFAASDEKLLEAAYVANAHRENMSELEEAAALQKLVAFYGSQRKAAQRLGITQAFISQRLSLLQLEPALQADLAAGARKVEHVRGLSKLPPQQQREKADARAAEAAKKTEKRKGRAAELPEAESDNAVITTTPRTSPEASPEPSPSPSDNAVITPTPSEPSVDVAPTDNGVITAEEDKDGVLPEVPVNWMPFHSWAETLRILRARMTPEEFERLMQEGQKLV